MASSDEDSFLTYVVSGEDVDGNPLTFSASISPDIDPYPADNNIRVWLADGWNDCDHTYDVTEIENLKKEKSSYSRSELKKLRNDRSKIDIEMNNMNILNIK